MHVSLGVSVGVNKETGVETGREKRQDCISVSRCCGKLCENLAGIIKAEKQAQISIYTLVNKPNR